MKFGQFLQVMGKGDNKKEEVGIVTSLPLNIMIIQI